MIHLIFIDFTHANENSMNYAKYSQFCFCKGLLTKKIAKILHVNRFISYALTPYVNINTLTHNKI